MTKLLEYLAEHEPGFRNARLPALYSDFQFQRNLNPDGYQANVAAWRRALGLIVRSGLCPSSDDRLVLTCDEFLLRSLESKQYGRPLALGAVVREAVAARDLLPLNEFLTSRDRVSSQKGSISWIPWPKIGVRSLGSVAGWAIRQLIGDSGSESLPGGRFVVVANVEVAGKIFADKLAEQDATSQSQFDRTFTVAHFCSTYAAHLLADFCLSNIDMLVLVKYLSRDKNLLLYDGRIVRIKSTSAAAENETLTEHDQSIAQLRETLETVRHQTKILSQRVDKLSASAKFAVSKGQKAAALSALRSRKLADTALNQRYQTLGQLEDMAVALQRAADNAQVVAVMEAAGEALRVLNERVGGVERVTGVVQGLRERTDEADEVNTILAEAATGVEVDELEVEHELEEMRRDERERAEAERRNLEEEKDKRDAVEIRRRLAALENVPRSMPQKVDAATEAISRTTLGADKIVDKMAETGS